MYDDAEKAYASEPTVTTEGRIEKRLAGLDSTIERLDRMTDSLRGKFAPVVVNYPESPSDPGMAAVAEPESEIAERIGNADRRIDRLTTRLASLLDRCDL